MSNKELEMFRSLFQGNVTVVTFSLWDIDESHFLFYIFSYCLNFTYEYILL